jgi:hypothetical protein
VSETLIGKHFQCVTFSFPVYNFSRTQGLNTKLSMLDRPIGSGTYLFNHMLEAVHEAVGILNDIVEINNNDIL